MRKAPQMAPIRCTYQASCVSVFGGEREMRRLAEGRASGQSDFLAKIEYSIGLLAPSLRLRPRMPV
jgi:hypothetical protein